MDPSRCVRDNHLKFTICLVKSLQSDVYSIRPVAKYHLSRKTV